MKKFFKEFFKVLLIASLILGISFTIFVLYFSHKNFVHGKVLVENEDFVMKLMSSNRKRLKVKQLKMVSLLNIEEVPVIIYIHTNLQ